jgi:putative glutamine amidotransferase
MFADEGGVMRIAVTETVGNAVALGHYLRWITGGVLEAETVVLSPDRGNADELDRCHGCMLTGGVDVNPALYGREGAGGESEEIDPRRDAFELGVIEQALAMGVPFLGICRGTQLFNVSRGGSLVPDLEKAGYSNHRKTAAGDRRHGVRVERSSLLHTLTGVEEGEINSSHHQAVDRVGAGLRVSARSSDGVIEALEWEKPEGKPFLLLVQWHPERMQDHENPLTRSILHHFARDIERFTNSKEHA